MAHVDSLASAVTPWEHPIVLMSRTAQLLSGACALLLATAGWLVAAVAAPSGSIDTAGVTALAAALAILALVIRSAASMPSPRLGLWRVVATGAVPACRVALRDPDAPGRGSRPRAPGERPAAAR